MSLDHLLAVPPNSSQGAAGLGAQTVTGVKVQITTDHCLKGATPARKNSLVAAANCGAHRHRK